MPADPPPTAPAAPPPPSAVRRAFLPLYRAAHWPDWITYQHGVRHWVLDTMLREAGVTDPRTIVEVGCGDGWVSHRLAERFPQARVIGFDINPYRTEAATAPNALVCAASAEQPPVAPHTAELVISLDVLEHIRDRVALLRQLHQLLAPGGVMIQVAPAAGWKVLQFTGFVPDLLRKQVRGLTRSLAGQRKPKQPKYREGFESNNPHRAKKKTWHRKLVPRVHGEYDSHLDEWRGWTRAAWQAQMQAGGWRVDRIVPLGLHSPYGFGLRPLARSLHKLGVTSEYGWVLRENDQGANPNDQRDL